MDFNVQWRDAEEDRLERMQGVLRDRASLIAGDRGLVLERSAYSAIRPTQIDRQLMNRIGAAAERLSAGKWRHMPSGALHDAANVSHLMPVAMLFVPSIGGISHSFVEDTAVEHLVLGAEVLAASVGT